MALGDIYADYYADEKVMNRIRLALEAEFAANVTALQEEQDGFCNLISQAITADGVLQGREAFTVAEISVQALRRYFSRQSWSRRDPKSLLPDAAVSVMVSGCKFLMSALPYGGTMRSYRNRRDEFINALASLAHDAEGHRAKHSSFHEELGRRVAEAVLEHAEGHRPAFTATESISYADIAQAALEQLVYFIGAGEAGPVKIGIAVNPQVRLATLQTAHHEELSILAITGGGRARELEYHEQFSAARLKGEWFTRAPEIEAEIARLNGLAS